MNLERSYWQVRLAPRCRLITSWGCTRSQGLGCSPIKVVRELGLERRETVRFLSVAFKIEEIFSQYERTGKYIPLVDRLFYTKHCRVATYKDIMAELLYKSEDYSKNYFFVNVKDNHTIVLLFAVLHFVFNIKLDI